MRGSFFIYTPNQDLNSGVPPGALIIPLVIKVIYFIILYRTFDKIGVGRNQNNVSKFNPCFKTFVYTLYRSVILAPLSGLVPLEQFPARILPYFLSKYEFEDITEKSLMCFEGFESLKEGLGMESLDLAKQPFSTLNMDGVDLSQFLFVSIVYNDSKL
jgi:hypothetical protein